jgi:hypothetical protein
MANTIHQTTLEALLRKRAEVAKLTAEIEETEAEILAKLKDGATIQQGMVCARIKSFERRNVSWKEKFISFVDEVRGKNEGKAMADRIHSSTAPSKYESLVVELP